MKKNAPFFKGCRIVRVSLAAQLPVHDDFNFLELKCVRTNPSLDGLIHSPTACRDYITTLLRCAARHDVLAILRWAL